MAERGREDVPGHESRCLLSTASLGDVSRSCSSFTELSAVDSYLSFNVSSPLCLTAGVLQAFPPRAGLRRSVVNVSSLCAVQPFPSWGLYCTGKAAREMMFRVLAEEEPGVRVLSYCPGEWLRCSHVSVQPSPPSPVSPGPLDTDMQELARTKTADPDLRKSFADMFADGRLLSCEESCRKLLALLLDDTFTSGARVDVYDL